ncbi:hypothetical protein TVAG_493840 [Trichomonas vaginalis G3]|uniref:Serine incorporator n=1 Tax=Trichomonas vaginalis (strain ATCC PRA-98 / G3) TaxID=412133 RepID=A2DQ15_TRIV3|nr:serine transport [Trichomonas vaginalis G3]EAY17442.1 hypothetical protein TVAG_493840 [Trichomonas vaginalis G3]KAI5533537.1 serine transport [Trichomonas vaginalis G3]|eukprot:XP_001329577.1 hypothetical protein [Trichomonas vaginalis G3]
MEYTSDSTVKDSLMGRVLPNDTAAERELKKGNLYYIFKFLIVAIFCFIFYNTGSSWIGRIIKTIYKSDIDINISLTARTTLALALWYGLHSLITVCNKNLTDSWQFIFHTSFLWAHTLVFIAIWVGMWFIPDKLFDIYLEVAKFISGFYLLLQIFFLVDWFHELNDKFYDENNMKVIIISTVIFTISAIVGFSLEFYFFCLSGCGLETGIVSTNLILCILVFLGAMFTERGSIFTASLVCCYIAYLTAAGLMCHTSQRPGKSPATCSRISQTASNNVFRVFSSLFTLAWMTYSAFSASNSIDACKCKEDDPNDDTPKFSLSFFHGVYALAAVYLTMIVTSWASVGGNNETASWTTDKGKVARWVNFGASWVTLALYILSLIAPLICPDRDFD